MQDVSALYVSIFSTGNYKTQVSLVIGDGEPETGYRENSLYELRTSHSMFESSKVQVGYCSSAEIDVKMVYPEITFEKMAKMRVFARITDGTRFSEWLPKGTFFIDTREKNVNDNGINTLVIHGYDSMLKAENDYPESSLEWPAVDTDIVDEIAAAIGVEVDERTYDIMTLEYTFPERPELYSMREVLGYIAVAYAGNFVITDENKLRLVTLAELPPDSRLLIDEYANYITFGGDRIIV